MRCPYCDKNIDESIFPLHLTYCPYCGKNIDESISPPHLTYCPYCGKELPDKVSFCPHCGRRVAAHITTHRYRMEKEEPTKQEARPIIEPPPGQKRPAGRLYKQWMKYADLRPETAFSTKTPWSVPAGQEKNLHRLPVMYVLLGFCLVMLGVGIALLLTQSC